MKKLFIYINLKDVVMLVKFKLKKKKVNVCIWM